jgi:hypothetical protein
MERILLFQLIQLSIKIKEKVVVELKIIKFAFVYKLICIDLIFVS